MKTGYPDVRQNFHVTCSFLSHHAHFSYQLFC